MNPIFFIPIRSGSKGLPDKNVMNLAGKPLVAYSIDTVISAGFPASSIFVSSDSQEYLKLVKSLNPGVQTVLRNEKLSSDSATTFDVLQDFLTSFEDDQILVLLQATTPFRTANQLQEALTVYEESTAASLVSVTPLEEPFGLITEIDEQGKIPSLNRVDQGYRRQNFKPKFVPNGGFFISQKKQYLDYGGFFTNDTIAYVMDAETSVDVDTPADFKKAVGIALLNKKNYTNPSIVNKINEKISALSISGLQHRILLIGDSRFVHYDRKDVVNVSVSGSSYKMWSSVDVKNIDLGNTTVIISLGINDIKDGFSISEIMDNVERFINKLTLVGAKKIIILDVIETFGRLGISNKTVQMLNEKLMTMPHATAAFSELDVQFNSFEDGLHFTDLVERNVFEMLNLVVDKEVELM
ncbi:MAG: cytidylyltransferase domain-containing protein [Weissella confusa]